MTSTTATRDHQHGTLSADNSPPTRDAGWPRSWTPTNTQQTRTHTHILLQQYDDCTTTGMPKKKIRSAKGNTQSAEDWRNPQEETHGTSMGSQRLQRVHEKTNKPSKSHADVFPRNEHKPTVAFKGVGGCQGCLQFLSYSKHGPTGSAVAPSDAIR